MSSHLATVKQDALSLSPTDRAELANDLLNSLEGETDKDLQQAWDIEICRRVNLLQSGTVSLLDAEDLVAAMKRKLNATE